MGQHLGRSQGLTALIAGSYGTARRMVADANQAIETTAPQAPRPSANHPAHHRMTEPRATRCLESRRSGTDDERSVTPPPAAGLAVRGPQRIWRISGRCETAPGVDERGGPVAADVPVPVRCPNRLTSTSRVDVKP